MIKRVGVITLFGWRDTPGMNATIRAVVRHDIFLEYQVIGIKRGFRGTH